MPLKGKASAALVLWIVDMILLSSCVATREDMAGLESQIERLEKNVDALDKKQADLAERLVEIKRPVENLNSNLMDTQNLLNNFNPKFEELRVLIEALKIDFAHRTKELSKGLSGVEQNLELKLASLKKASDSSAKASSKKTKTSTKTPSSDSAGNDEPEDGSAAAPLKLFEGAYKDYLAKRWGLAQSGFEGYLKSHPEGSLADKSLYYLALSLKQKKMYPEAHAQLDKLTAQFPKSPVTRSALLEKAKLYLDESKKAEAEGMLEYLAMTQSETKEAEEAKELLKQFSHSP